jgi:hypothetical protein
LSVVGANIARAKFAPHLSLDVQIPKIHFQHVFFGLGCGRGTRKVFFDVGVFEKFVHFTNRGLDVFVVEGLGDLLLAIASVPALLLRLLLDGLR